MKISPLSFNLNSQIRNSKIQNQPSFKAVWNEETLRKARQVSEETGVDVLAKLNSFLDSNPKLKEFGGDKVKLSIHPQEFKTCYCIGLQATMSMYDDNKSYRASYQIFNDKPGEGKFPYWKQPNESDFLEAIARGDKRMENDLKDVVTGFQDIEKLRNSFCSQIVEDKRKKIQEECGLILQTRLDSELPAMPEKLSKYLGES